MVVRIIYIKPPKLSKIYDEATRIAELKAIYSGNPIQISKRKVFLDIIYEMEVEPSILTPISSHGQLTLKYIRHVLQI